MNSIEKVSKVKVPVLVIHGTEDEVVDFSHGVGIFKQCPQTVEPLWVEGMAFFARFRAGVLVSALLRVSAKFFPQLLWLR